MGMEIGDKVRVMLTRREVSMEMLRQEEVQGTN